MVTRTVTMAIVSMDYEIMFNTGDAWEGGRGKAFENNCII